MCDASDVSSGILMSLQQAGKQAQGKVLQLQLQGWLKGKGTISIGDYRGYFLSCHFPPRPETARKKGKV